MKKIGLILSALMMTTSVCAVSVNEARILSKSPEQTYRGYNQVGAAISSCERHLLKGIRSPKTATFTKHFVVRQKNQFHVSMAMRYQDSFQRYINTDVTCIASQNDQNEMIFYVD